MASLPIQDQANAIWKALDDMLEKDPQGYKRYIEEQMQEAKNLKLLQNPKSKGAATAGGQGSSKPGAPSPLSLGLDMLLGQLGLNNPVNPPKGKVAEEKSGDGRIPLKRSDSNKLKSARGMTDLSGRGDNSCSGTGLLDDNIGGSVIASIVTNKTLLGEDGGKEEEEDLVAIKFPTESHQKLDVMKGKPLIEEL